MTADINWERPRVPLVFCTVPPSSLVPRGVSALREPVPPACSRLCPLSLTHHIFQSRHCLIDTVLCRGLISWLQGRVSDNGRISKLPPSPVTSFKLSHQGLESRSFLPLKFVTVTSAPLALDAAVSFLFQLLTLVPEQKGDLFPSHFNPSVCHRLMSSHLFTVK